MPRRSPARQAETEERQKEAQRAAAAGGGILAAAQQQREEDIYAHPQPLSKTLLPQDDSGAAKEYEGAQFGPSQVGGRVAGWGSVGLVLGAAAWGGQYVRPAQGRRTGRRPRLGLCVAMLP